MIIVLPDPGTEKSKPPCPMVKKYEAEYRQNKQAAYEFFWRMAYFLEESGNSGAAYFKKAYMVRKEKGMLFRYYLARLNLYKLFNRFVI